MQTFGESTAELVTSVALLIGAIGGIIAGVAGFMKAGKARDFAISAGQVAQLGAQKAVEAKDRVKGVTDALYTLTPADQKKVLDSLIPSMTKMTEEVNVGTAQVNKIDALFPEFQANKLEVPREKFQTKPNSSGINQ